MHASRTRNPGWIVAATLPLLVLASPGCGDGAADGLPEGVTCATCHGDDDSPAPPLSIEGATDPTAIGVGAHRAHVAGGALSGPFGCDACHRVPRGLDDEGHIDPLPAEIAWGDLATAANAAPAWDRGAAVCANVYCHGATLSGGTLKDPEWTRVDGTQTACGTCHGAPPPAPHPTGTDCRTCHPLTIAADGSIDVAGGHHVDGVLDVPAVACNNCHGSAENPAPPAGVDGTTQSTARGVGAHQAHVRDGTLRKGVGCDACHGLPDPGDDPADHADGGNAEVDFGPLARTGGSAPAWDGDGPGCADVYCHGATLSGGTLKDPEWTRVDGTQTACGTCHGAPPPAPHPTSTDCRTCHPLTIAAGGAIDVAGGHHIDGVLDAPAVACNTCHGDTESPAPPAAVDGSTLPTARGVGAHREHLRDGPIRRTVACDECHEVPGAGEASSHADGGHAEVFFGPVAKARGALPEWDGAALRCAGTYCHGATLAGGSLTDPLWVRVDGTQTACGTCHGNPPPTPHPDEGSCRACHPATINASGGIDVAGGAHINGRLDLAISGRCGACHDVPPDTGSHRAHVAADASGASYGDTGRADTAIGHVFGCGNCHPTDDAFHGDGAVQVDLDPTGAPPGSARSRNAADATYVPGPAGGVDGHGMAWTRGTCSGAWCHSAVEVRVPGPVPLPGSDFQPDGPLFDYPPFAVERERVFRMATWGAPLSCDGCHGFPPRTRAPDVQAAAGDSHSWIADDGTEDLHGRGKGFRPIPCAACHYDTVQDQGERGYEFVSSPDGRSVYQPVAITGFARHANGVADVAFTPEPVTIKKDWSLADATWNPGTRTCADVGCHILQTEVAWGRPYRWPNFWECNVCHQK